MLDATERALVLQTRQGHVEAYGELVRRHQASVFNACFRLLGERREAEDLTQETFIRAYERLDSFDAERPFGPWIRRVAVNMCLNHLRRISQASFPLDEEYDLRDDDPRLDPERVQERRETAEILRSAILALPPHFRAVIELRHFQGMAYEEISAVLDRPLSDVKSHLFRARRLLAQRLKPSG